MVEAVAFAMTYADADEWIASQSDLSPRVRDALAGLDATTREDVLAWADHLDRIGVAHSGVQDADYGTALSFTDPDGNALEFFAST